MANLLLAVIYVAFISLGLPDAVLGAAWPTMGTDLNAPVSWEGGISMTISAGTIVSALLSDRMTLRFGAGKVTVVSRGIDGVRFVGSRSRRITGCCCCSRFLMDWEQAASTPR